MDRSFTAYLWANWLIVAFLVGLGYSAGCWLWATLVSAVRRKG